MQDTEQKTQKRNIIFIKTRLQIYFVFFVMSAVFLGMVLFAYEFLTFLQEVFKQHPTLLQKVYEAGPTLLLPLIVKTTLFFIFLAIIAALLSNKIAGPLYNIEKTCKKICEGETLTRIKFREGDALEDLEKPFNQMLDTITKQNRGENK